MGVPSLGASAGRSTTRSRSRLDQRERTRADRPLAERMVGQARDRHVGEQVGRGDGLGRGLEEPADWRVEREPDRPLADGLDRHPGPRGRARAGVVGVLQGVDREGDVGRGDRLAVVPEGVLTELERPRPAVVGGRPAGGEVRHHAAVGAVADEPGEQQRNQIAVGLRARGQRADRLGVAEHALAVGAVDGNGDRGIGRRRGRGRLERRGSNEDGDDGEGRDEGENERGISAGHQAGVRAPPWPAGG